MATDPAANLKKGQKAWHPFRLFRDKDTQLFAEEKIDACQEYLCHEAIADCCRNRVTVRNQFLTCKCLHILRENDEAQESVARYMLFFLNKSKPDRQQIIMEWLRYTQQNSRDQVLEDDGNSRVFLLPFIADDENDDDDDFGGTLEELRTHKVCKSAIACIMDFGITKWATCQDAVDNNRIPVHGNKNRVLGKGKRFQNEVKDDLLEFFEEMKQFAQPQSTRFVREESGTGLRDGYEDVLELPSSWFKRWLYQ